MPFDGGRYRMPHGGAGPRPPFPYDYPLHPMNPGDRQPPHRPDERGRMHSVTQLFSNFIVPSLSRLFTIYIAYISLSATLSSYSRTTDDDLMVSCYQSAVSALIWSRGDQLATRTVAMTTTMKTTCITSVSVRRTKYQKRWSARVSDVKTRNSACLQQRRPKRRKDLRRWKSV